MTVKGPLFSHIKDLIEGQLKNASIQKSYKAYPIWKNWEAIVGPAIAQKTNPDLVRGKTLVVSVENSVWMQELQLQKNNILEKIRSLSLEHPIEDIRFRLQRP